MASDDYLPRTTRSAGGYKRMEMLEMGLHRDLKSMRLLGSLSEELLTVEIGREVNAAAATFRTQLLADRLPPADVDRTVPAFFSFPASPFQHWKSKHAGTRWLGWFVRRWPVRTEEHRQDVRLIVHLERYRTYPEADIPVPDDFGRVVFWHGMEERIEYPE